MLGLQPFGQQKFSASLAPCMCVSPHSLSAFLFLFALLQKGFLIKEIIMLRNLENKHLESTE